MYGIHEVVSHLTKLGVGCEIICSKEGRCHIVCPDPTGKVTSLTSRIGWTKVFPECSFPVGVGGFNTPCALQSRWAATVDLILFLGGYPSDGKDWDIEWAVLFLSAADFFSLTVTWGVGFNLISVVSSVLEGDFTFTEWVDNVDTTGGSENSHLSSLRNVWGNCGGVTGGVFSPSSKDSSDISGEGEKDHYP